jgi:hypothetical protein
VKNYIALLILFIASPLFAINIDGSDGDWINSSNLTAVAANSSIITSTSSLREWVFKDKVGDQIAISKADITELRITSDASCLYLLARIDNLTLGTTDYVTPMLQVAISYSDGGKYEFVDSGNPYVRNEKVASDAGWEFLLSLYQKELTADLIYKSTSNTGIALYKDVNSTIQKSSKGNFAIYRDTTTNSGCFEASVSFADIGGLNVFKNNSVKITAALFENNAAFWGSAGDASSSGMIDCISLLSLAEEIDNNIVDTHFSIRFNESGMINANSPPVKLAKSDVYIDGQPENSEVVVVDRLPVYSWEYRDVDADDNQKAVNIQIANDTSFNSIHASFTEFVEEDVFRVSYPSSATALQPGRAYYMRVRIMDATGSYGEWSETLSFTTVSPAINMNEGTVDLKIDWNNPFYSGEVTKIRYNIPSGADKKVFMGVYSLSGRLVKTLVDNVAKMSGVIHTEYWDGKDENGSSVASGTYIVHLRAGSDYKTAKVCFVR